MSRALLVALALSLGIRSVLGYTAMCFTAADCQNPRGTNQKDADPRYSVRQTKARIGSTARLTSADHPTALLATRAVLRRGHLEYQGASARSARVQLLTVQTVDWTDRSTGAWLPLLLIGLADAACRGLLQVPS